MHCQVIFLVVHESFIVLLNNSHAVSVLNLAELVEQYSCLIPVLKALLEKSEEELMLASTIADLPSLKNSPVFFQEFQTFCFTKSWKKFIAKIVS